MARFLIDESLPRSVGAEFAVAGHDTLDVRDCGLRGAPDGAVHARGVAQKRVFVSGDTDFAALTTGFAVALAVGARSARVRVHGTF